MMNSHQSRARSPDNVIAAVVFDMDGLMVDTEPLSRQVWNEVLSRFGYRMDDLTHRQMVGRRTSESARIVLERYRLPFTPDQLVVYKNRLWEKVWQQGVPEMPGLRSLQAALARRGVPWAVATSSPRRYAQHVLQHLGCADACVAVAAGDEVRNGKPAPDIYLLAASRLGASPEACLALEDSVPGGRAAKAAGMTLVAIPNGNATAADFAFADYVFGSLDEVVSELDQLLGSPDGPDA